LERQHGIDLVELSGVEQRREFFVTTTLQSKRRDGRLESLNGPDLAAAVEHALRCGMGRDESSVPTKRNPEIPVRIFPGSIDVRRLVFRQPVGRTGEFSQINWV
jgi:hypothetical protein